MFTPLGVPVCLGKNGTTPSGMSNLNLVGPGSGKGITGLGVTGNIGTSGTNPSFLRGGISGSGGVVSTGILSTAAFTIAKPIGTTNKLGKVADKSRIKPILSLFPWLQDMQAPL